MIRHQLPLQKITSDIITSKGVELYVYRTDLNHKNISGNKLYKLKYNLEEAKKQNPSPLQTGKKTLLTFGGAFSNHIAATAAAGKEYGFNTIGIIRGDELEVLNPTLTFAKACGMQLHFVSRSLYQNKATLNTYVQEQFGVQNYYSIPEGGSNALGIIGCKEITKDIPIDFDIVCCPCGTGATITGIILSLKEHQQAIGFQVLKGEYYIKNEVTKWLKEFDSPASNWEINEEFHFGGYAKLKPELLHFIQQFEKENAIPLDYIYTGKMMYGIFENIKQGKFKRGSKIIAIHTGGLQGNRGFEN
ncbi:MAG: 1-aminocyclopropane-1-carboxylate deaminase/D-cysteine desulfhydrase [Bacteroidetes bacterium]|nr:1-aminocyclopropane-1-carboxylate deaminase/D-cysteine desulfhydrase [Bacteroidota bacterium]